jgi:cell division protease FtsH
VTYQQTPNPFLQQPGLSPPREISEETARMIDQEVRTIIESRLEEVLKTLREHEDLLHLVAAKLLEKETLESEEFLELIKEKTNQQPAAQEA